MKTLTPRQQELSMLRLRGHEIDEIAAAVGLESASVKFMLHQIYLKIGVELSNKMSHREKLERFRSAYDIYHKINRSVWKQRKNKLDTSG